MEPASKLMPQNILRTAPPQVESDMFKNVETIYQYLLAGFNFALDLPQPFLTPIK